MDQRVRGRHCAPDGLWRVLGHLQLHRWAGCRGGAGEAPWGRGQGAMGAAREAASKGSSITRLRHQPDSLLPASPHCSPLTALPPPADCPALPRPQNITSCLLPADGVLNYSQDGHRQRTVDWCDATGGTAAAFDFTLKVGAGRADRGAYLLVVVCTAWRLGDWASHCSRCGWPSGWLVDAAVPPPPAARPGCYSGLASWPLAPTHFLPFLPLLSILSCAGHHAGGGDSQGVLAHD